MFLSRMALDLTRDETFPFLHSPQLQYQMIQNAFTQDFTDFLWRTDYIDGRFWVVILSSQRPPLLGLHSQCGFEGVFPSWEINDYDSTLDEATEGSTHSFSLYATPVEKTKRPMSLYVEPQFLYYWLTDHSREWGFEVVSFTSISGEWKVISGNYILYGDWSGQLRITDENLFSVSCRQGIGPNAKFGAGLLTIDHAEEGLYNSF